MYNMEDDGFVTKEKFDKYRGKSKLVITELEKRCEKLESKLGALHEYVKGLVERIDTLETYVDDVDEPPAKPNYGNIQWKRAGKE